MKPYITASYNVPPRRRALLIAEIGINHGGDIDLAKRMIDLAKDAGADVAKFQHYRPALILGHNHPLLDEAKKCQFKLKQHEELKAHCDSVGIEYCVSLFHFDHVSWAEDLGVKRYKVASRSIFDTNLLSSINKTEKPVIISCGMAFIGDIRKALDYTRNCNQTILKCLAEYPTPLNLANPYSMVKYFELCERVGFSSHCPDIAPSIAAACWGASVIEQHVCISRNDAGCDIPSSLTFQEFKQMAKLIRSVHRTYGGK